MDLRFNSAKQVILKVQRDFGIQDNGNELDMIEWIVEAMELIGTMHIYTEQSITLPVVDNAVTLPCSVEKLINVKLDDCCLCWKGYNPCTPTQNYPMNFSQTVSLHENKLIFSFTGKDVVVIFKGFQCDEEGYPMVPDNPHVREALSYYIMYRLLCSGNTHPVFDIKTVHEMWIDFKVKAKNAMNFPYAMDYADKFQNQRSPNSLNFE